MLPGECSLICDCDGCGQPATYCESVPDASVPGYAPFEAGYRLKALCWAHNLERRQVATARIYQLLRCEQAGVARLDRDRAGGDVVCEHCGRKYYDHRPVPEWRFMTLLCDGSVVKL